MLHIPRIRPCLRSTLVGGLLAGNAVVFAAPVGAPQFHGWQDLLTNKVIACLVAAVGLFLISLVLRGILWSGEHSSAQIGDRVVQKGEAVQGWTIVDIKQSSVTLASHGVTITLQLHEGQS